MKQSIKKEYVYKYTFVALVIFFFASFVLLTLKTRNQELTIYPKQTTTVFVQKISQARLEQILVFPAMVQAFKEFPQQAFFRGIVHEIPVRIGNYVHENQPIYKMQQINPGQEFLSSWVNSLNSGVIVSINVVPGDEVQQNMAIITVADLTHFKAILSMSAKDIDKLTLNMPVYLMDNDKNIHDIGAKVTSIPMIPNSETHLFDIEITIPKDSNLFLGKMENFVLLVEPFEGISVPQELIVQRGGQSTVTVVRDRKIVYQPVELGPLYQQSQAILSGLSEDDLCVISSSRRYHEGDEVTIETIGSAEPLPS